MHVPKRMNVEGGVPYTRPAVPPGWFPRTLAGKVEFGTALLQGAGKQFFEI